MADFKINGNAGSKIELYKQSEGSQQMLDKSKPLTDITIGSTKAPLIPKIKGIDPPFGEELEFKINEGEFSDPAAVLAHIKSNAPEVYTKLNLGEDVLLMNSEEYMKDTDALIAGLSAEAAIVGASINLTGVLGAMGVSPEAIAKIPTAITQLRENNLNANKPEPSEDEVKSALEAALAGIDLVAKGQDLKVDEATLKNTLQVSGGLTSNEANALFA